MIRTDEIQASNLSRLLYSVFALMEQTRMTDTQTWTDKRLHRMSRKRSTTPPMVSVITLRRAERYGYHEEGTGRWLTYRAITRGHWRRQHHKVDGQDRVDRIWIHPYERGPKDAPLHQPTRVTSLSR